LFDSAGEKIPEELKVEGESGRRFEVISDESKGCSDTNIPDAVQPARNQRKRRASSFAEPAVVFDLVVEVPKVPQEAAV
jgi:hypothetical protein